MVQYVIHFVHIPTCNSWHHGGNERRTIVSFKKMINRIAMGISDIGNVMLTFASN